MLSLKDVERSIPQEHLSPGDLERMIVKTEGINPEDIVVDGDRHAVIFRKTKKEG
jgi:hypothetical protein